MAGTPAGDDRAAQVPPISEPESDRWTLGAGGDRPLLQLRAARLLARTGRGADIARDLVQVVSELLESDDVRRARPLLLRIESVLAENPERLEALARAALERGLAAPAARMVARAAQIRSLRGEGRAARTCLGAFARRGERLPGEAVATLAEAWWRLGEEATATQLLLDEADRLRLEGNPTDAIALAERAAALGCDTLRLHRTLGLALLGEDRAGDAFGHLALWREDDPDDPAAHVWCIEALWSTGREGAARRMLASLCARLGIAPPAEGGAPALRTELERVLRAEALLCAARMFPFWEAEDTLRAEPDPQFVLDAEGARRVAARARRRIFLAEDPQVGSLSLSQILGEAGFDVAVKPPDISLADAVLLPARQAELLIVPVAPDDPAAIEAIRSLWEQGLPKDLPVLGFSATDRLEVDRELLRELRIQGLLDKSCSAEHVVFRVDQLIRPPAERRRYERAPAFLRVDLTANGATTVAHSLNISLGGMSVTSSRPLDPNTDVAIRIPVPGTEPVHVRGRVIYRRQSSAAEPWELGVFFYPLDKGAGARIAAEVERLLRAPGHAAAPAAASAGQA